MPDWLHPYEGLTRADIDRERVAEYRQFVTAYDVWRALYVRQFFRRRSSAGLDELALAEDTMLAARGRLEV